MRERVIFECEYCSKKRLINKTQMKRHEDICWYNPKNKSCLSCGYYMYEPAYFESHSELEGCPSERIGEFRYCFLKDISLNKEPIVNCKDWKDKEADLR